MQVNQDLLRQELAICAGGNPSAYQHPHGVHNTRWKDQHIEIKRPNKVHYNDHLAKQGIKEMHTYILSRQRDKLHSFQWRQQPKLGYSDDRVSLSEHPRNYFGLRQPVSHFSSATTPLVQWRVLWTKIQVLWPISQSKSCWIFFYKVSSLKCFSSNVTDGLSAKGPNCSNLQNPKKRGEEQVVCNSNVY